MTMIEDLHARTPELPNWVDVAALEVQRHMAAIADHVLYLTYVQMLATWKNAWLTFAAAMQPFAWPWACSLTGQSYTRSRLSASRCGRGSTAGGKGGRGLTR
jgi:hypothetical protein